jgi:OOP family OmpA-OmpF porin
MIRNITVFAFFIFSCAYSFAQQLEPTAKEDLLIVSVINEQNKHLSGERVSFTSEKTKKIYGGITDTSGKFLVLVPKGATYNVKYKQFTSDTSYKEYKVPMDTDLVTINYVIRIHLPKTYILHNVFFDIGKATIRPESDKELSELADFMSYQKTMVIEVAGYTDNVGNESDNQKLSQSRADAVKNYLIKKGVHADKVQSKGYGSADPVASNDTPAGKQQNRRTEIHILKQ